MGSDSPALEIVYAKAALRELEEIWEWNAEKYSAAHAGDYIHFLRGEIATLSTEPERGRTVDANPVYRYIVMRRGRGDGHVAVYRLKANTVRVLHIFHTKQDWPNKL